MKLFSRSTPKIKIQETKKEGFNGWLKCTHCQEIVHLKELEKNLNCCPKCEYHYRFSVEERINLLADKDSFEELFTNITSADPLEFQDSEPYTQRIVKARKKSGKKEGVTTGVCTINLQPVALGVMDFSFMGGSMGSAVGEKLTLIIEHATENNLPLIIVAASGGARMQESTLSLMQMAKTSAALTRLSKKQLPFISVLTNPTTGGVTASFASLGDVIIAEPKALICFAGPRVIEQTIKEKLPKEAQKSEFLLEHGMIDRIVTRREMKKQLSTLLEYLVPQEHALGSENDDEEKCVSLSEEYLKQTKAF